MHTISTTFTIHAGTTNSTQSGTGRLHCECCRSGHLKCALHDINLNLNKLLLILVMDSAHHVEATFPHNPTSGHVLVQDGVSYPNGVSYKH